MRSDSKARAGSTAAGAVRSATPDDSAAIAAIWNPVIRDSTITFTTVEKTPADLDAMLVRKAAEGLPFLVAESAGAVAGFATFGPFRAGPGYARTVEHSIMVAADHRGAGLGRALLAALEAEAARRGVHALIAAISAENPDAIAFHAAAGFLEAGRLAEVGCKFGRWIDLCLMQKRLDAAGQCPAPPESPAFD